MSPVRAWLALGSNLGDRHQHLAGVREAIANLEGTSLVLVSPIEETPPLDGTEQPDYLNQMLLIETDLAPDALLASCHELERKAGRERSVRWAARTLDIDLVRYDSWLCDRPDLVLPHPGLRDRTFWATEIATVEDNV